MIAILDCGSQFAQNIARRVREHGYYAEIVSHVPKEVDAVIISGGPRSVHETDRKYYDEALLNSDTPVLGICYGLQTIAHRAGGTVTPAATKEYGETRVIPDGSELLPDDAFTAWMSHGDTVEEAPPGYTVTARSANGHVAALEAPNKGTYAVQFHPEVDHTEHGRAILARFLERTDAAQDWDMTERLDRIQERLREQVAGKTGIGGVSGGVDSTTASVLVSQVTEDYHPIFIDNGLLRQGEAEQVRSFLRDAGIAHTFVDASDRFLDALDGVADPDEKRRIIGATFIDVFTETAEHLEPDYLVQGTIYPDRIESSEASDESEQIKRHHNVGGLPEELDIEVVEPFKDLFKDEVREVAEQLDIPAEIRDRHPFPGPGLAIRTVGAVTPKKLETLRHADAIYIEELKERGLYDEIAQAFCVLTDTSSHGVMGDAATYQGVIALRAVTTEDYMTADWYPFQQDTLTAIANRIVNEVDQVNRVVYDVTQKPPGTIEWE